MKKICSLILFTLVVSLAHAQTFKPFKVDVSLGYANPRGNIAKAGVLFALEPKYALADALSLGLRWEGALTAAIHYNANGQSVTSDVNALSSYLVTADYYFSNNRFRPFAGAGTGLYRVANISADDEDVNDPNYSPSTEYSSKYGFMLRGGFEFGHFRAGLEYNIIGERNNYLGIKLGVCFGGGRLERQDN
jgi:outer membrane protein W